MTTNPFEMALTALLQQRAKEDTLFAETLKKEGKSISECVRYIYGELYADAEKNKVGNASVLGVSDADVLAMAVHYYDEDKIEIKPIHAQVKTSTAKTKTAAPAKKEEPKKPVKKNPLLESIKNSKPKPKTEDKPKLADKVKETKKVSKKKETPANDFVGTLFDF